MLSDKEIVRRISLCGPTTQLIQPFFFEKLGPVSYDLTTIQESSIRGVRRLVSKESFVIPRDLVGLVCLRSRSSKRGIFASFSQLIDPGYTGHLIFLVWKPESPNEDFGVKDLFQVMFFSVEEVKVTYDERPESTAMGRTGFTETTDAAGKEDPNV